MFKNVASQKLIVFAFDSTTNLPKTGDAANITAYVSKDYGAVTVLGDTSATEMDATNAKGYYLFDLTQAETNGDTLLFSAKSATSNIVVVGSPATVFTLPASFTSFVTPTNLTAAQIATGVWQDATAGDFTATNSIGKSVMNGIALGTGLTVNDLTTKTGFALTAAYDAAKTASQAGDAMALTAGERTTLNTTIKTTAITESYRANGAAPTEAQFMCEVLGHLGEQAISGTTKTVKKLDHSTTAETFTLDSATAPTSITRAT